MAGVLTDLAFFLIKLLGRAPRGGAFAARSIARLVPGLRNYKVSTKYGDVVCDLRETVCWPLVRYKEYPGWKDDEALLPTLGITKKSIVLDIGANLGVTVMQYAKMAGHVHAFEPAPRALHLLRQNVSVLSNVTVHAIAIGDKTGTATFAEESTLDTSHFAEEGIEVPVKTIDSLGIDADFIKIDVEGFEHLVLAGATETLKKGPIILFEALDEAARDLSTSIILAANPSYKVTHAGGQSLNYLAKVR